MKREPVVGEIWETYGEGVLPAGHQVEIIKVDADGFEACDLADRTRIRMWSRKWEQFWDRWRPAFTPPKQVFALDRARRVP